ncbi:hypothetical protein ACE1CI_11945 [Aerosakkonemataceae cyanobacterium BLCC-F50]|uniref:Uncharacterized protein n=1 Tax=Floridaenema flaviceps BLCC-F50 TaxID=3153642 RepID=A0ABV4XQ03_9CYAN
MKKNLYSAIPLPVYLYPPLGILSETVIVNEQAVHLVNNKVLLA